MALCQFRNVSGHMVILRCVGPEAFSLGKVIFPFEEWQWFCPPESRVDIWSRSLTGADLVDTFPAAELAISCDVGAPECSREVHLAGRSSTDEFMILLEAVQATGGLRPWAPQARPAPCNSRSKTSAAVDSRRAIEPMRRTERSST